METKVSITQRISVILAAICYVLTIYSFFTQDTIVVLVCFVLHSIFLLYASYLSFMTRADYSEFQHMSTTIEEVTKERDEIQKGLLGKIAQRDEELSMKKQEYDTLKKDYEELKSKYSRLTGEFEELTETHVKDKDMTVLPSLSPGEKTVSLDLLEVAREVIGELKPSAIESDISFSISSAESKILMVAEWERVKVIFKNILDNAIKHSKKGDNVQITASKIGNDIYLVFKDNGDGVLEDEVDHLFDMNFQGTNKISGTGLGLYQVRKIVEHYNGSIYAKSSPNNGMGIYVELPALR